MARTPKDTMPEQHIVTDADTPGLPAVSETASQVATADAVIMDSFDAIKAIGRIETAQFYATVAEKVIAETAISLKEGKKYKGLPYQDENGNTRHVATFDEFCEAFLGKSARRIQELMQNYNVLGPALYEQAEKLGLRQRDYNAIKALPADDQAIVKQAIEADDKDKVIDLLQDMAVRHRTEKEALAKQTQEAQETLESARRLSGKRQEEINKLQEELELLRTKEAKATPDEMRAQWRDVCQRAGGRVSVEALSLAATVRNMLAHTPDQTEFVAGVVAQAIRELRAIQDEHHLAEHPTGEDEIGAMIRQGLEETGLAARSTSEAEG